MAKIELFRPKQTDGTWNIKDEKLYFLSDAGDFYGPYDKDFDQIRKYFNGMYTLSEAFLDLAKKGNYFSFIRMLQFVDLLSKQTVLINGGEFCELDKILNEENEESPPTSQKLSKASFTKEKIKIYLQMTCLAVEGDSNILDKLVKNARVVNSKPGDILIAQGSEGKEFCLLMNGKLGVYQTKHEERQFITELNPVCIFGESPAISGNKRNAEVSALQDSWTLAIRIQDLMDTTEKEEFSKLKSLRTRLLVNQILSSSSLFYKVPPKVISQFINKAHVVSFKSKEVVVKEGEYCNLFYVVLSGRLEVDFKGRKVAELKKGDFFGEAGAVWGIKRTATVRAISNTYLIRLHSSDLYEILCSNFCLAYNLETEGVQRMTSNQETHMGIETDSGVFYINDLDHSFSDYSYRDLDFSSVSTAKNSNKRDTSEEEDQ